MAVLLSLVAMGAALRPARLASRTDPTALPRAHPRKFAHENFAERAFRVTS